VTKSSARLARLVKAGAVLALLAFPGLALGQDNPHDLPAAAQPPAAEPHAVGQPTAEPQGSQPQAAQPRAADLLPPPVKTHHTIRLPSKTLNYIAVAGSIALPGVAGAKPAAEIFYVAYAREPLDAKRPITFVFNGGPGAAAAYLHLGGIGPRMVEANDKGELRGPPPRLVDNPSTWLGMTDLVFVDPVGTGYGRAADPKDEEKYWGVEQDTDALTDFVRLYLIGAGRMVSPVFLVGESYGGFRAVALTRKLQTTGGISPSGMVLISPALNFALLNSEDYDPLTWALTLPSLAAVNLESKGVTGREPLGSALKDAERYALSDYLVALASGAESGGKLASATVAELTGLPLDIVERRLARVSPTLFIKEFDRAHGQMLSRYDGTVRGPDPNPASSLPNGPDPVLDATAPLWTAAFVQYAQSELKFHTNAPYRLLNREVRNKWDFGTSPTRQGYADVVDDLQQARATNPSLQVMIAKGYTDLITPYLATTYLVNQLPTVAGAAPIEIKDYLGGHMLYMRPTTREALKEDAKAMYGRALKGAFSPEG
jgi:carboxypeptidase C (cathepsin A)